MTRKVAVIGTGQTVCQSRREDVDFPGLIFEATHAALADAELTLREVDAVVFGSSSELFSGVNHPEKWCLEASGGLMKPQYRVQVGGASGSGAAIEAYHLVASGMHDVVLAVAGDMLSQSSIQYGLSTVVDPILGRDFAAGAPSQAALQARWYMHRYGITEEQTAKVAVKNRRNALLNPYAQLKINDISVDKVLKSPYISSPIRLLDSCPVSDGASALVVASGGRVIQLDATPAWFRGVSLVAEGRHYAFRDWSEQLALREAARRAYAMAEITDPLAEIDVAEVFDAFSYQELMWTEGLGFCAPGEGGQLSDEGLTSLEGELPVNPSGGVLSANTIGDAALRRVIEAALQVTRKAEKRQVPNVKTALAHGMGGTMQFHSVVILSSEPGPRTGGER